MELNPEKMDGTLHHMRRVYVHDAVYRPFFLGITTSNEKLLLLFLII